MCCFVGVNTGGCDYKLVLVDCHLTCNKQTPSDAKGECMNATDFISKSEYEELKAKADKQEDFNWKRELKINGSTYQITIQGMHHMSWKQGCTDRDYHIFLDELYNVKAWKRPELDQWQGMGGGGGCAFDMLDSYEKCKDEINRTLKKFPDYDELEQITLF